MTGAGAVGPRALGHLAALGAAAAVATGWLVAGATPATATITGPCTATGSTQSSGVDVTTAAVWHVRSSDTVVGEGAATREQTTVHVSIQAFGVPLGSIVDATGKGDHGRSDAFEVSRFSTFARILAVSGSSDSCYGDLILIVDDVNPLTTVAGGVGTGLAVLSVAALAVLALARPSGLARTAGTVVGLLGGVGLGELLQQTGFLSPTSPRDLAVPVAGAIAGGLVTGALRRAPRLPGRPA